MISVVIPLYNKKDSVAHSLECVLNQTYQEFEVVVVDDGSTDGSAEVVEGFVDERIRLIRQENGGVSAARNRGIEEARSEYVAFLDADDEWKPEHLQTLVGLMEKYPQCGAYSTNYEFKQGEKAKPTILNKIPFDGEDGVLTNYFEVASCSHPPVCSITICIRKSLLNEIGGFPVGIKLGEDILTWARIAVKSEIIFSKKVTAVYMLRQSHSKSNRPILKNEYPDCVGKTFVQLLKVCNDSKNFKKYISKWYKGRANTALRWRNRRETMMEALKSIYYFPTNYKSYVYLILAFMPEFVIRQVLK